jgi:SAM-dependent methyltransferase
MAEMDPSILDKLRYRPEYNGIYDDLLWYTELSEEELNVRLLRKGSYDFQDEFKRFDPQSKAELNWYYRSNVNYLFANAVHPYWPKIDILPDPCLVLDFGAGAGNNVIELDRRGFAVDYLEPNALQFEFIKYRIHRKSSEWGKSSGAFGCDSSMPPLNPFISSDRYTKYRDLGRRTETVHHKKYDAIILEDVLEHILDYHEVVHYLIMCLDPGGLILEKSPFAKSKTGIAVHLHASVPLPEAMVGMEPIEQHVWRKL